MILAIKRAATVLARCDELARFSFGSDLDTVRDGGRYDGALGVVSAVAAVGGLHEIGVRLPFAVEIVVFADEEGLRFQTT